MPTPAELARETLSILRKADVGTSLSRAIKDAGGEDEVVALAVMYLTEISKNEFFPVAGLPEDPELAREYELKEATTYAGRRVNEVEVVLAYLPGIIQRVIVGFDKTAIVKPRN